MIEKAKNLLKTIGTKFGLTKSESVFLFYFILISAGAVLISYFYSAQKTNELNAAFRKIDEQYEQLSVLSDSSQFIRKSGLQLGKININKSSASEIEKLPGIGEKTAALIVTYREEIGFYRSNKDLLKIKGIGESKLARILPFLEPDSLLKKR